MIDFAKKHDFKQARFSMLIPYPGTEMASWVDENNYWTVDNPAEELVKYADMGEVKPIYETPEFPLNDKIEVYNYLIKEWDDYELNRDWKKRFKQNLIKYKPLYHSLKMVRDAIKA